MKHCFLYKVFLCILMVVSGFFVVSTREIFAEGTVYEGLRINEAQLTGGYFVEVYNGGSQAVSLKGYTIRKIGEVYTDGSEEDTGFTFEKSTSVVAIASDKTLLPGGYFLWANSDGDFFKNDSAFPADQRKTDQSNKNTLPAKGSLALFNGKEKVGRGTSYEKGTLPSLSYFSGVWKWTTTATPKAENIFTEEQPDPDPNPDPEPSAPTIRFTEVFPDPETVSDAEGEFVELHNYGSQPVDLSLYEIFDGKTAQELFGTLAPGEYRALFHTISLTNAGKTLFLRGVNSPYDLYDSVTYEQAKPGWSWAFDGSIWRWTPRVTPDGENKFPESVLLSNVILNEMLPDPEGVGDQEFIELYNMGSVPEDISFWSLSDASGASYLFPEGTVLDAESYLFVTQETFQFSLNNTNETVYLKDPVEKTVDEFSYTKTNPGVSLGFDGKKWRATASPTPGGENIFEKEAVIKEGSVPKKAYQNVWVYFSAKVKNIDGDSGDVRYKWEFGDGKTSTMQNPKHRYTEKKTYTVKLRVDTGRETTEHSFSVKVTAYPKRAVHVTAFEPNPEGLDTEGEWLRLKNDDKKDINLKGWIVATGKEDPLTEHLFEESMVITSGEEKTIFRSEAVMNFPNTGGIVEIRYPDGKTADRVAYAKEGGIAEGDVYRKDNGKWTWNTEAGLESVKVVSEISDENGFAEKEVSAETFSDIAPEEVGKSSRENKTIWFVDAWDKQTRSGDVLGASSVRLRLDGDRYMFTEARKTDHYAVTFWRNIKQKLREQF